MNFWTHGKRALALGLLLTTLAGGWWAAALDVRGPLPTQALTSTSVPTFAGLGLGTTGAAGAFTLSGQSAHVISIERNTTADTAGQALSLQAGGATTGATDKAGGALLLLGGRGTGTGLPGPIRLQTTMPYATSGTTDEQYWDRLYVGAFKQLTNNSAIPVLSIGAATSIPMGVTIWYTVEVYDGTSSQVEVGQVYAVGQRSSGTTTTNVSKTSSLQLMGAGTLAATWSINTAQPAMIALNANSSLTPAAGYPRVVYTVLNGSGNAIVPQ